MNSLPEGFHKYSAWNLIGCLEPPICSYLWGPTQVTRRSPKGATAGDPGTISTEDRSNLCFSNPWILPMVLRRILIEYLYTICTSTDKHI